MAVTDVVLVARVLSGNQEAFRDLVDRYKTMLYAVAVGKTGNFAAAEDIVQSAWLEAYVHLRSLRDQRKFRQWLWGITVHLAAKWVQRQRAELPLDELNRGEAPGAPRALSSVALGSASPTPDRLYEAKEMRGIVLRAVEGLPEKYREAVLLYYMEGMTYREMAELLGVPESTILGRLQVARKQLKEDLMGYVAEVLQDQRPTADFVRKVMSTLPPLLFQPSSSHRPVWPQFTVGSSWGMVTAFLTAALLGTTLYWTGWPGRREPEVGLLAAVDSLTLTDVKPDWQRRVPLTTLMSVPQARAPQNVPSEPMLSVSSTPTDSLITFTYTLPESAFVELLIFDRTGNTVAIFVQAMRAAGEYVIQRVKTELAEGQYFVTLRLNHAKERTRSLRSFQVTKHERATASQDEKNLLSHARQAQVAGELQESMALFDTLLQQYPRFIDRGAVYSYALPTYAAIADSTTLYAAIDSLVRYLPRSDIYHHIAQSLHDAHRFLPTAVQYAKKAVQSVDDDALLDREDKRFWYLHTLGELLIAVDQDTDGERTLTQALTIFHQLPPDNRWVQLKRDVDVLRSLGVIQEQQMNYDAAIRFYQQGLARAPRRTELWTMLQRAYTLKHGSDDGYNTFREAFENTLPKEDLETPPDTPTQQAFPAFTLQTLDHQKLQSAQLRDKVVVVNFWAYWCTNCLPERLMLERLSQDYRHQSVEIIGIHLNIGTFGNRTAEERYIRAVMKKSPTSFPTLIDTANVWSQVSGRGVPTSFILDKRGHIRYTQEGYDPERSYEAFKRVIERLIAE